MVDVEQLRIWRRKRRVREELAELDEYELRQCLAKLLERLSDDELRELCERLVGSGR